MNKKLIIIASLILFTSVFVKAQDNKIENAAAKHSPKKAAIMSMVLPGLGQAYNKKYWKIPIIYAGVGIIAYAIDFNYTRYNTYRNAYILRTDGDSTTIDDFDPNYIDGGFNESNLLKLRNYYRRYLDLSFVSGFLLYVLNVIDANVDAHLYDFNVNDDLSLRIEPYWSQNYSGITVRLNLK